MDPGAHQTVVDALERNESTRPPRETVIYVGGGFNRPPPWQKPEPVTAWTKARDKALHLVADLVGAYARARGAALAARWEQEFRRYRPLRWLAQQESAIPPAEYPAEEPPPFEPLRYP